MKYVPKLKGISYKERFFKKVDKTDTCWIWNHKTRVPTSYGWIYDGEAVTGAHRFSYEIHVGKIPKGKLIMHTCDNTKCVNPLHLKIGTPKENSEDMVTKQRQKNGRNSPKQSK